MQHVGPDDDHHPSSEGAKKRGIRFALTVERDSSLDGQL